MNARIKTIHGTLILGASLLLALVLIGAADRQFSRIPGIQTFTNGKSQLAAVSDFDNALVAHYAFDEGSGTTAADSLNGHSGTETGLSYTSGKIGAYTLFLSRPVRGGRERKDHHARDHHGNIFYLFILDLSGGRRRRKRQSLCRIR